MRRSRWLIFLKLRPSNIENTEPEGCLRNNDGCEKGIITWTFWFGWNKKRTSVTVFLNIIYSWTPPFCCYESRPVSTSLRLSITLWTLFSFCLIGVSEAGGIHPTLLFSTPPALPFYLSVEDRILLLPLYVPACSYIHQEPIMNYIFFSSSEA